MCYDSLAEEEQQYSRNNSLTKCWTQDPRNPQPFSVDQQIKIALPSSPAAIEDDEEGDFGPAQGICHFSERLNSGFNQNYDKIIQNPEPNLY